MVLIIWIILLRIDCLWFVLPRARSLERTTSMWRVPLIVFATVTGRNRRGQGTVCFVWKPALCIIVVYMSLGDTLRDMKMRSVFDMMNHPDVQAKRTVVFDGASSLSRSLVWASLGTQECCCHVLW